MKCQICREETTDLSESTYVSRHYLKNATGQTTNVDAAPSLRAVHLDCIHLPHMLSEENLKKWLIWKVVKQDTLIQELQTANQRLEEALRSHAQGTAPEIPANPAHLAHPDGA